MFCIWQLHYLKLFFFSFFLQTLTVFYFLHLLMMTNRFRREIPHFIIYLVRLGSKYSGGRGSLVSKFSYCKFGNILPHNINETCFNPVSETYFGWCRISSWFMYVKWLLILSSIHSLLSSMTLSPSHTLSSSKTYVNRYSDLIFVDIIYTVCWLVTAKVWKTGTPLVTNCYIFIRIST